MCTKWSEGKRTNFLKFYCADERYNVYMKHFVCFDCKLSWKSNENYTEHRCRSCRKEGYCAGRSFKTPRKKDENGWRLAKLIADSQRVVRESLERRGVPLEIKEDTPKHHKRAIYWVERMHLFEEIHADREFHETYPRTMSEYRQFIFKQRHFSHQRRKKSCTYGCKLLPFSPNDNIVKTTCETENQPNTIFLLHFLLICPKRYYHGLNYVLFPHLCGKQS